MSGSDPTALQPSSEPVLRVLMAPQEFKRSLTARQAAEAMERGAQRASGLIDVQRLPLSDGGPGLIDALVSARQGEVRSVRVADPLDRPIDAAFGLLDGGTTAVIEMAAASGLALVEPADLDPLRATTFGTGQLIAAALDAGARNFIIGIGGSATNDGGAGMAQALGVRLLNSAGRDLPWGGEALASLSTIDLSGLDRRVGASSFVAACDVRNPLTGPNGASAIYGPQKGATPEMVGRLDAALRGYAAALRRLLGRDISELAGAGAAGGLGAGLVAFLGAELRPGFPIVAEATGLDERLQWADLVMTGEGALDAQTGFGKTVAGVTSMAEARGVPVIVLAGSLGPEGIALPSLHGVPCFSVVPGPVPLELALSCAAEYLEARTAAVLGAVLAGMRIGAHRQRDPA